jgi:hypothetical protein
MGSKGGKCKTQVSECMDLGYLLHLEPTHLLHKLAHGVRVAGGDDKVFGLCRN